MDGTALIYVTIGSYLYVLAIKFSTTVYGRPVANLNATNLPQQKPLKPMPTRSRHEFYQPRRDTTTIVSKHNSNFLAGDIISLL